MSQKLRHIYAGIQNVMSLSKPWVVGVLEVCLHRPFKQWLKSIFPGESVRIVKAEHCGDNYIHIGSDRIAWGLAKGVGKTRTDKDEVYYHMWLSKAGQMVDVRIDKDFLFNLAVVLTNFKHPHSISNLPELGYDAPSPHPELTYSSEGQLTVETSQPQSEFNHSRFLKFRNYEEYQEVFPDTFRAWIELESVRDYVKALMISEKKRNSKLIPHY